jgi:hypothetical protein
MRKLLTISLGLMMLSLLVATALSACRGAVGRTADIESWAPSPTTTSTAFTFTPTSKSTTPAASTDTPQAEPSDPPTPTADQTSRETGVHFVCPDGGMDQAITLQRAVDDGHQPWWLSAPDVAAACTFGVPGTAVEPAGTNRYQVSHGGSDEKALVDVTQPLGPNGIWVVVSVTPLETTGAPNQPLSVEPPDG